MKSDQYTQDGAMEAVAELVGWYAAARLAARLGGRTLHIPELPQEDHPITLVVGLEKSQEISAMMGGENIELPSTHEVQREMELSRRDEIMCEMAARGLENKTIARWLRVDHRTVKNVLQEKAAVVEAYKAEHPRRPSAR